MRILAGYWLLGWLVLNVLAVIAGIGKPRKPIDAATAIAVLVINSTMAAATVVLW